MRAPTRPLGLMDFASGAIGTIIMTFDVWAASLPPMEIYGTQGSLSVPDPNGFEPLLLLAAGLVQPQDLIGDAVDVNELAVRGTIDTVDGEQYRQITRKAKPRVHGWSPDRLATCGGVRQWAGGRT